MTTPTQPERSEREPLAPTDYTRAGDQPATVTVPDDVTTAAALIDWLGDDPSRVQAAREFNDARPEPWVSVQKAIDALG